MKASRTLYIFIIASLLFAVGCSTTVRRYERIQSTESYSHESYDHESRKSEDRVYKIQLGIKKTEQNDVKISFYQLECEDPNSLEHCIKIPSDDSKKNFRYTLYDGYTRDKLELKEDSTNSSYYVVAIDKSYPECLNITVQGSNKISRKSKTIWFYESRTIGC